MDEKMIAQLFQELGVIKGIQNQILEHLKKLNGTVREHDEAINKLQTVQERHKTYFKLIGTVILIIVTVICAVLDKIKILR